MHSHGKWLSISLFMMLGGCLAIYDYDAHDGNGTTDTSSSGMGGAGGSTSSSSSSGIGGAGGSALSICLMPTSCPSAEQACVGAPCAPLQWAQRFGTIAKGQQARMVAVDKNGNIILGGTYVDDAFTLGGTPTVNAPALAGTTGFVAMFDGTGNAKWINTINDGKILGVASDPNGMFVIAAGFNGGSQEIYPMVIQKLVPNGTTTATVAKEVANFGGGAGETRAVGVDVTTDAIYVLGSSTADEPTVMCGSANASLTQGMFVAKYDHNLACKWIKSFNCVPSTTVRPAAINAQAGIWITGSFSNNLAGEFTSGDGVDNMFLINLDADGTVIEKHQYGQTSSGPIEPAAINVDTSGNVFVTGTVSGANEFDALSSQQTGVFVFALDPSKNMKQTRVFPGSSDPAGGARGTGIALAGDSLFVSGTFSQAITLAPGAPVKAPSPGVMPAPNDSANTPFLAIFDPATLTLQTFDYYPGYGESFSTSSVFLAAHTSSVVIAGAWRNSLDFSRTQTEPNYLDTPASDNADIFAVKFKYPP